MFIPEYMDRKKHSQQVHASLLIKWMRMIPFVQCYEHSFANQKSLQVLSEKMCFFLPCIEITIQKRLAW